MQALLYISICTVNFSGFQCAMHMNYSVYICTNSPVCFNFSIKLFQSYLDQQNGGLTVLRQWITQPWSQYLYLKMHSGMAVTTISWHFSPFSSQQRVTLLHPMVKSCFQLVSFNIVVYQAYILLKWYHGFHRDFSWIFVRWQLKPLSHLKANCIAAYPSICNGFLLAVN